MTYIGIFIFKIIEDALATLRLIVVSNGKKFLGASLQFICTLIWIILTGTVLIDFMADSFKVISFAFGSFFGSYLGSLLEEKIALGTNLLTVKVKKKSLLPCRLKEKNIFFLEIDNIFLSRHQGRELLR